MTDQKKREKTQITNTRDLKEVTNTTDLKTLKRYS